MDGFIAWGSFLSDPSQTNDLSCHCWVTECSCWILFKLELSKLFLGYMDFSKLLHGFVKIDKCMSLSFYMDLSKLLHGFVKVVTWICQSCFMYFSPFAKQNQAEAWPRFQCLLKLLLWTQGVECVKVVSALGPFCLFAFLYKHGVKKKQAGVRARFQTC